MATLQIIGAPTDVGASRRGASMAPEALRIAGLQHSLEQMGLPVKDTDMRHIDEVGMRQTMQEALANITPQTRLHLSLDVDFLDPTVAPGVGTVVRGGPTYLETQLCMEMMADTGCLGSLDLVELNPACDVRNATAELVVELVQSLFGQSTLLR
jgi:arginase